MLSYATHWNSVIFFGLDPMDDSGYSVYVFDTEIDKPSDYCVFDEIQIFLPYESVVAHWFCNIGGNKCVFYSLGIG